MANEQAWKDFEDIKNQISGIKQVIKNVDYQISVLEKLKDEIWGDPARKAEFKILVEENHDSNANTITKLAAIYTKLKALSDWLEQNTYLT